MSVVRESARERTLMTVVNIVINNVFIAFDVCV